MTDAPPVHPLLTPHTGAMKQRAVRGALATSFSQAVRLAVQIASVIVLARLLSPGDFGVFAMVVPIVGFATLFQDLGLSQALIASPNVSHAQASAMFRLNAIIALGVAIVLGALAPYLAVLYDEPRVTAVAMAMAGQILLAGLTVSHLAMLARGMKFHRIAGIEVTATLLGFAAAVAIAVLNPSPWALVAQALTAAGVTLVGAWLMTGWRPSRYAGFAEMKPMLKFGVGLTSFNLSNYVSRNADNILIGWAHGASQLGLYDRAYKLLVFPLQQINTPIANVMVPVLSRLTAEPARYREAYLKTVRQMLLLTAPGVVLLIVGADVLIPFLMGDEWRDAVPIFMWLGLAACHQIISNTFGWLFVSQQRAGEYARFGLFSAITCVAAFVAGLPWGGVGVAMAYGISGVVLRLPAIVWWVGRSGPVSSLDIVKTFAPFLVAMMLAGAVWLFTRESLSSHAIFYLLQTAVLVYAVAWITILMTPSGRSIFGDTIALVAGRRSE